MNLYASSGFRSSTQANSKSFFSNDLTMLETLNSCIELRSIVIDNKINYMRKFSEPIMILKTREKVDLSRDETFIKTKIHETVRFDSEISFMGTIRTKKSFRTFYISSGKQEFNSISNLIDILNEACRVADCDFHLGSFGGESGEDKVFFARNRTDKYEKSKIKIKLPRSVAYSLGFTNELREMSFVIPQKTKKKAQFKLRNTIEHCTMIWLKERDMESTNDYVHLFNHIFKVYGKINEAGLALYSMEQYRIGLSNTNISELFILKEFLDRILSSEMKKLYKNNLTLEFKDLKAEFYPFYNTVSIYFKNLDKPKLIKVFCDEISHTSALTTASLNLIGLLPYSQDKNYTYESENPLILPLYPPKLSKISIKLTDENNQQLQLATGSPTFIHCRISNTPHNMFKTCHFSSDDRESLKYFPNNSQSCFTQILIRPIDARNEKCHASLQSLYIPPAMHNIDKEYTCFSVEKENGEVEEMMIDSGFYTDKTFIAKFNDILKKSGVDVALTKEKLLFTNHNQSTVQLKLNSQLAYLLGCTTSTREKNMMMILKEKEKKLAHYSFKFLSLVPRFIKLKTDFLTDSLVGNSLQPIFRIIHLDSVAFTSQTQGTFIEFSTHHWVEMYPNLYNKVNLALFDENDQLINFSSSEAVEGVFVVKKP